MKLKPKVDISTKWKGNKILLDIIETTYMSLMPLGFGMLFAQTGNIIFLIFGLLPIFFKFIYNRESGKRTIYIR